MGHISQVNNLQSILIDGIPNRNHLDKIMIQKTEWLVNLGSTALEEPDNSPDDGSREHGMTLQDKALNTGNQNAQQPYDLIVCLKTRFTLFPFREVPGTKGLPLGMDLGIMRERRERRNELPRDPKWTHMQLACRCPIRKILPTFKTWIYVKAYLVSARVESRL